MRFFLSEKIDPKTRSEVLKAQAVRQATIEVLSENRAEIITRARAKLVALGVELSDDAAAIPQDSVP